MDHCKVHQLGWGSLDAGGSDADQIEGPPLPMLTQGEDVEAHALKERGWSISAIARHLGRDRQTVGTAHETFAEAAAALGAEFLGHKRPPPGM